MIEELSIVEKHGRHYLYAHVKRGSDEAFALKSEGVFLLRGEFVPRVLALTLPHWPDIGFPKAFRSVGEIMDGVDLKKKNGIPVKFFLDRGAHASRFSHGGGDVEIPLENAVIDLVMHLAEHPTIDLSGYPPDFVGEFRENWRRVHHLLSAKVTARA